MSYSSFRSNSKCSGDDPLPDYHLNYRHSFVDHDGIVTMALFKQCM